MQDRAQQILEECMQLEIGDPIAVVIGSNENNHIILDTFFLGVDEEAGKVRALMVYERDGGRPLIKVHSFDPRDVRTSGCRSGIKRAPMHDSPGNENNSRLRQAINTMKTLKQKERARSG